MKIFLYWTITILLLAGGFAAGMFISQARNAPEPPAAEEAAKPEPMHIELTAEQVQAAAINAQAVRAGTLTPELKLFGILQEDPDETFTVRAPISGTVQLASGKSWPMVGLRLPDNTTIGTLQPRAVPSDEIALAAQRVALQGQVATAQADVNAAAVELEAARAAYERLKALNAQDKNVSDRVVEEALAKVKSEEVHLDSAKQALAVAKAALPTVDFKLPSYPLVAVRGGEVVEVACQPEESVEAGQVILRVSRLDHLLAAVDLPLGRTIPDGVTEARIVTMNNDASPLTAKRMGLAPIANAKTKDNVLLFRLTLTAPAASIRPGTPVTAYLPLSGEPLKGYVLPRTAVVRYQGRAWVYRMGEVKPDKKQDFERREVQLENPTTDGQGWFVMQGFTGSEKVVTTGAAELLSVETNTLGG